MLTSLHYSCKPQEINSREGRLGPEEGYASAPRTADPARPSNPGFKAHLRHRSVIRGDAEAALRERPEDPGEPAAAFPDMLADDPGDKNVIRPASVIPAAGLELLPGRPEIQRRGNRWRQI